jgi:hypothetical protein
MSTKKIGAMEWVVVIFVFAIMTTGFVSYFFNPSFYSLFTTEDGLVEWLTVIGLLIASFISIIRSFVLMRHRHWYFLLANILLGLFLFVAAGEEISWGQRILDIESSEYFRENNTQGETNFHNLVVNGVRINRIFFSFILIGVLSIYLIFFPLLYRKTRWMKHFADSWGIPVPKTYQTVSFLILFAYSEALPHEKRAELLECGGAWLLLLIIALPLNRHVFARQHRQGGGHSY